MERRKGSMVEAVLRISRDIVRIVCRAFEGERSEQEFRGRGLVELRRSFVGLRLGNILAIFFSASLCSSHTLSMECMSL